MNKYKFTLICGTKSTLPCPRFKCAFTLAEVLITLGIIGIVAALTMPALTAKYQEKQTVAKLKKFYSVMDNAFKSAIYENGTVEQWLSPTNNKESAELVFKKIEPYIKTSKVCGFEKGCWSKGKLYHLNDAVSANDYYNSENEYKFILADGTMVVLYIEAANKCWYMYGDKSNKNLYNVCGDMKVLVNNKSDVYAGRDAFWFHITKYGIFPTGTAESTVNTAFAFPSCRRNVAYSGAGCTAWVLYNENMDYLHCDDLAWNGKTKCSGK